MAGGPPTLPPEVTQLPFFFSNFSNSDEAAEYIADHDLGPGTFLLRPSTRNPSALTLTITIENRQARHVNVHRQPDSQSPSGYIFFIIPERQFCFFHDLYAYYTSNAICNLEQVSNVRLLNPLNRAPVVQQTAAQRRGSISRSVANDEIPPLPMRKSSSTSSAQSAEGARAMNGGIVYDNRGGIPQAVVPPLPNRFSLDSAGSDTPRTSSSSNGSGPRDSRGAEGGGDISYLAPGSPGFSLEKDFNYKQDDGACGGDQAAASPPPLPLSKKEQKKQDKEREKQEREREKQEREREKQRKKEEKKKGKKKADMGDLGWCRPPMPTPDNVGACGEDEPPYYTTPRQYKNHLDDLKKMLRESEICDCGLRMMDAELVNGWTVHRSRESATFKRVFYQHEDGNTTWLFPESISQLLSVAQVEFIVNLCKEAGQLIAPSIERRHEAIMQVILPNPISPVRSRSNSTASSTSGSNLALNRGASLDQRPPMQGPGAQPW